MFNLWWLGFEDPTALPPDLAMIVLSSSQFYPAIPADQFFSVISAG